MPFWKYFTALPAGTAGLVVNVQNVAGNEREFADLQARVRERPGAVLLTETLSRTDIYALEAACDCFVSLHRSEGFGLAVAECMYLEKPVIATDWSATAEFVTDELRNLDAVYKGRWGGGENVLKAMQAVGFGVNRSRRIELAIERDDAAERLGRIGGKSRAISIQRTAGDRDAARIRMLDDHARRLFECLYALPRRVGVGDIVI